MSPRLDFLTSPPEDRRDFILDFVSLTEEQSVLQTKNENHVSSVHEQRKPSGTKRKNGLFSWFDINAEGEQEVKRNCQNKNETCENIPVRRAMMCVHTHTTRQVTDDTSRILSRVT